MGGQLEVRAGFQTERGRRDTNEDFGAVCLGTAEERARLGVVAVVADGVGGAKGGRVAAEVAGRGFIDFYLGQPELRGVRIAAGVALEALNRWIHALGRSDPRLEDMASTFTALILRGRQAHVVHVGDSRAYRLRDGQLTRLTEDHTLSGAGRRHVLTRALGLTPHVQIDHAAEEMLPHDRFLLCSDGVHGVLEDGRLREMLARRASPEETAARIAAAALEAGSHDNVTALALDVLDLPAADLEDLETGAAELPILPPPKSGACVDEFALGTVLADGQYSRVFRGLDRISGQSVLIKFPKPVVGADALLRAAFLRESWISVRVKSPFVGAASEIPPGRRSCLYTVMPFYEGETLEARLLRQPPVGLAEGVEIAIKMGKGVAALHRAGVVHRDIKPENVILQPEGSLKIVDLGVARLPRLEDDPRATTPGTPSYMAPELIAGGVGDEASDLFALGVTIYRMFTGTYPYGEIEPYSHPAFNEPAGLTARRRDLPAWLERAVGRAVAARPENRYADVLEFVFELEHGADRGRSETAQRSFYARDPVRFWQLVAAALAAGLLLALALGR